MAERGAPVDEGVTHGGWAYDRESFRTMANDLYARANRIEAITAIGGALAGACAAAPMLFAAPDGVANVSIAFAAIVVLTLVGGLIGKLIGAYRAFLLRFQAQAALCQIVIEERLERLSKR